MHEHQILVGNVGTVCDTDDEAEAERAFQEYVQQSQTTIGRAGAESVTWMRDDDIYKEYRGEIDFDSHEAVHELSDETCRDILIEISQLFRMERDLADTQPRLNYLLTKHGLKPEVVKDVK